MGSLLEFILQGLARLDSGIIGLSDAIVRGSLDNSSNRTFRWTAQVLLTILVATSVRNEIIVEVLRCGCWRERRHVLPAKIVFAHHYIGIATTRMREDATRIANI